MAPLIEEWFDTWWEFRLAFSDLPDVRLFMRDRAPVSSRFVQPAVPHRVFIYDEASDDPERNTPREIPYIASIYGPAYADAKEWARVTRAWWSGQPIGVIGGQAVVWNDQTEREMRAWLGRRGP